MRYPEYPEPIGVFRCIDRPTYEVQMKEQLEGAAAKRGTGDLNQLFHSGETWTVS
ncbi:MAG: hypothetical protein R3C03_16755 [Pirellulaceae bacterium]